MFSFSYLEPVCCFMSSSNCCFLTCIQISKEAAKVIWYYIVKGFGVVSKAEVDIFLEFSCSFYDSMDVGNLISGYSAFSISGLNIWKFMVHILLKPGLENFDHYFASMWDECNCAVVWTFFGIALLWDWNENWHFPVLWPLLSLPNSAWKFCLARAIFCLAKTISFLWYTAGINLLMSYLTFLHLFAKWDWCIAFPPLFLFFFFFKSWYQL